MTRIEIQFEFLVQVAKSKELFFLISSHLQETARNHCPSTIPIPIKELMNSVFVNYFEDGTTIKYF
jgi:hypothetical protein